MNKHCPQLRIQLENIKARYSAFCLELEKAKNSKEYESIFNIQKDIETNIKELKRNLYPLENLEKEDLKRQYNKQVEILKNTGLLETLSSGEMGIVLNGQEYPIPSLGHVKSRMFRDNEFLDSKIEAGFKKLLLVPFGLDIVTLAEKYKQVLLKHHQNKTLLDVDGSERDLNRECPVAHWKTRYTRSLVYFPQAIDKYNYRGNTKDELEPWQIFLVEDNLFLPASGTNQTPKDYLKKIIENNEQGLTPESWLILAITYLEEQNKQIDDWQGPGRGCYLLGGISLGGVTSNDTVLAAEWSRLNHCATLNVGKDIDKVDAEFEVRSSVMIK